MVNLEKEILSKLKNNNGTWGSMVFIKNHGAGVVGCVHVFLLNNGIDGWAVEVETNLKNGGSTFKTMADALDFKVARQMANQFMGQDWVLEGGAVKAK